MSVAEQEKCAIKVTCYGLNKTYESSCFRAIIARKTQQK
jgi:hypothetical protein